MATETKRAKGVVFRVHTVDFRGKDLYSLKFEDTGDNDWYRLGEERYAGKIEEGYTVEVQYTVDKKGNMQVTKARCLEKGELKQKSSGGRGNSGGGGNTSKPAVDWDKKDGNIQYQSARNAAIEFLGLLCRTDSIKLPAKTKQVERRAALEAELDRFTAQFFTDIASRGSVERFEDETEVAESVPAKSKKSKPAKDDDDGWDEEDDSGEDEDGWDD